MLSPADASADAQIWTVRPGDALSVLAQRFGVTVEEIKKWNALDSDMIRVGQSLIILERQEPEPVRTPLKKAKYDEPDWSPPFEYEEPKKKGLPAGAIASTSLGSAKPVLRSTVPKKKKAAPSKPGSKSAYVVRQGDTLTKIAHRFQTTVPKLISINPGLRADRIFVGDRVYVTEPPPRAIYTVDRGDTLARVASRYDVTTRQLQRWNQGANGTKLRLGSKLTIYSHVRVSPSESVGAPHRGRLEKPVQLPKHRGYFVRTPQRAWGTTETVNWIEDGFDAVAKRYKYNKPVRVHDISDRDGGPLRDHRSHQSGRDVDISFHQRSCGASPCAFKKVKPNDLDVGRVWTLLEYWLKNGQIENAFIDYRLQKPLYKFARSRGATKAQLEQWFQYPRGQGSPYGVVRHFAKHDDHMHVRFVCPLNDSRCH